MNWEKITRAGKKRLLARTMEKKTEKKCQRRRGPRPFPMCAPSRVCMVVVVCEVFLCEGVVVCCVSGGVWRVLSLNNGLGPRAFLQSKNAGGRS